MKVMLIEAGAVDTDITILDTTEANFFKRHFTKFREEMSLLEITRFAYLKALEYKVDAIMIESVGVGSFIYDSMLDMCSSEMEEKLILTRGRLLR